MYRVKTYVLRCRFMQPITEYKKDFFSQVVHSWLARRMCKSSCRTMAVFNGPEKNCGSLYPYANLWDLFFKNFCLCNPKTWPLISLSLFFLEALEIVPQMWGVPSKLKLKYLSLERVYDRTNPNGFLCRRKKRKDSKPRKWFSVWGVKENSSFPSSIFVKTLISQTSDLRMSVFSHGILVGRSITIFTSYTFQPVETETEMIGCLCKRLNHQLRVSSSRLQKSIFNYWARIL